MEPFVFWFGSLPPVVVSSVGSNMYVYQADHSSDLDDAKKVQKYVDARARGECQALMTDARKLLKFPGAVLNTGYKQRLSVFKTKTTHTTEAELLQELENVKQHLNSSIARARTLNKKNAHRNYRRKRQQVKKLQSHLRARVAGRDAPPESSDVSRRQDQQYTDMSDEFLVLSPERGASCELVKETIMNEFWRRIIKERTWPRLCSQRSSISRDQQVRVPCF